MSQINFSIFKNNLKSLLRQRNILEKDLAEEIGVTRTTLSRYMSGERTPDLAYVINMADYFGVSVEWLLGLNETALRTVSEEEEELLSKYAIASKADRLVIQTILQKYEA